MSITNEQAEFIQSYDGDLSPEQAAQLLEMAENGDTGAVVPETGSQPAATPEQTPAQPAGEPVSENQPATTPATTGDDQAAAATVAEGEIDPAKAVVMAKDGVHTIPYEKLVEARNAEKQWKAQAEAAQQREQEAQQQLATLQQQAQARADAGIAPSKTDNQIAVAEAAIANGVDASIFGDFSDEAMAKGIKALVEQQVAARVDASVKQALQPLQAKEAINAEQAHFNAIFEKHPDAESLVESKELADWMNGQPSFVRNACQTVLQQGTAQEIIELFDRFKQATGTQQIAAPAAETKTDARQVAKQVIANTQAQPPASLSDFPAGRPGAAATQQEAMAAMDSQSLLDHMQGMSPEQIEQFLNRRI